MLSRFATFGQVILYLRGASLARAEKAPITSHFFVGITDAFLASVSDRSDIHEEITCVI